ncbi:APC family permease [Streptomyces vastus]|uniref:APC family permease n=1 Tax=Streptomyces vastus TaxID=285451 RepID=A0ABN3QC23_9ACTN
MTWRTGVLLAVGTALLVCVSLGPMAEEIGNASIIVWLVTALVGGIQCVLLGHLAVRMPNRSGGAATYTHAVIGDRIPILGALSSWGYWFAWTPGIAVNLILAAEYLKATVLQSVPVIPLVVGIAAILYIVNALGLRISARCAAAVAVVAVAPLLIMTAGLLFNSHLLDFGKLLPLGVPEESWAGAGTWILLAKWAFVAAWSAYGAEMAFSIVAEMRKPQEHNQRMVVIAGLTCFVAFGFIPILLTALVGSRGLAADPSVVFLQAAELVFGGAGATMVGLMLAAGLILGAQAFVVGSSRIIFQMTVDGYLPARLSWTNRRGVPVGSLLWDIPIVLGLVLVFGTNVVDVVASANFGYIIVFILMPIAYIVFRRREHAEGRRLSAPRTFNAIAVALLLFNTVLLIVGGMQWGLKTISVAAVIMALVIPMAFFQRRQRRRGPEVRTDEEKALV